MYVRFRLELNHQNAVNALTSLEVIIRAPQNSIITVLKAQMYYLKIKLYV